MVSSLIALLAAACSGGGSGSGSDAARREIPFQFEPSEPGLLTVGPAGLTLEEGQTRSLEAALYDSVGVPLVPDEVRWTSETPGIATVAPDGTVRAQAVGMAILRATDAGRRVAQLAVDVVPDGEAPAGPVGARFEPPVLNLTVGERRTPFFVLTAADGDPLLTTQPVRLVTASDRVDVSEATGEVTGVAEGLAVVQVALVDNEGDLTLLAGDLLVLVLDPDADTVPEAECEWQVVGGDFYRPPTLISRPGLTAELRTLVYERKYCTGPGTVINGFPVRARQVAPARVAIEDTNVARLDGTGLLESVLPGRTRIAGLYQRFDGSELEGPAFMVSVLPDLGGTWRIEAPNDDQGEIVLPAAPAVVEKRPDLRNRDGTTGPASAFAPRWLPAVRLRGESNLLDRNTVPVCSADAAIHCGGLLVTGSFSASGACSDQQPGLLFAQNFPVVRYCGMERHPVRFGGDLTWTCTGPDTLKGSNGVVLRRGPGPAPGNELASVRVNGVLLEDPNPNAEVSSGSGEILVTFFNNGNTDDFGIALALDGITAPGTYTLANTGSLQSAATNFAVYGRFDPLQVWSSSPGHLVRVDVEQIDASRLVATFSGRLMDLGLAQPDVVLTEGRVQVDLEDVATGTGSFTRDGVLHEARDPEAEWDGSNLEVVLEDGAAVGSWRVVIDLENVTAPGTYVASVLVGGNSVSLSRYEPRFESWHTIMGHQVTIVIDAIDGNGVRGTFQGSVHNANLPRLTPLVVPLSGRFDIAFSPD